MGDRRPTRAPTSHFRLRARSRRCPITPPYTNHPPLPHIPLYRSFLNLVISAALRADLTYSHIVRVRSHVFISTMLLRYLGLLEWSQMELQMVVGRLDGDGQGIPNNKPRNERSSSLGLDKSIAREVLATAACS